VVICANRAWGQVMKPLRVEFDMAPGDLATAAAAIADRDPNNRKSRGKAQRVMVGVILFLVAVLAFDFTSRAPRGHTASMACVIGAVIGLVLHFPTRRAWSQAARKQTTTAFTTPAGKASLGPRSVEVGDDGIAIASGFARTLFTWRGVIDVVPTADHLVVIFPGPVYLCVPQRAFDTDSDFERFGEVVTELAMAGGGLTGRSPPS
jgi:hypothetical protein